MLHPAFRSIFAAAALLLLAACGAPAAQPVASPSPSAEGSSAADMAATRMISHAMGETEVPANPQRIAVVGYNEVEELMALGITPIAALYPVPPYLPETARDIPIIGNDSGAPNLEKLLALKPDLIIGVDWAMEDIYDELSQIAPSVVVPRPSFAAWKDVLRFTADVVGRSAQAEELLIGYDERVAEVRAAIGEEKLATTEVTAFRPYTDGSSFLIWIDRSFPDTIMADVGIRRPEAQRAELPEGQERIDNVSLEKIPLLDADVIFLALPESGAFARSANEGLATWLTTVEANPLWKQLRAVQNERVYKVDMSVWNEGSVLAANALLNDLEQYLAEGGPTSAVTPEATEQAGGTRTITHALGTIDVTGVPQRVVALEWTYVEDLLALGIQPVGVADVAGYSDWVRIPVELDPGVQDVGTRQEPNLEAIAQLKPDLIITAAFRAANNYDQLSAIAPTIAFDPYPTDDTTQYDEMRATFMTIAELLDRAAQGQAVLEEMDAALADAKARLTEAGHGGETFVLAQAFSANDAASIRLFTDNALATQVVEQIGLQNAWEDAPQQYGFSTVGLEGLAQLGDTNFFYVVPDDDNVFEAAAAAPVWNSLRFVQTGRAYPLGSDTWLFGGPLSMELLVEKVTNALLEE